MSLKSFTLPTPKATPALSSLLTVSAEALPRAPGEVTEQQLLPAVPVLRRAGGGGGAMGELSSCTPVG